MMRAIFPIQSLLSLARMMVIIATACVALTTSAGAAENAAYAGKTPQELLELSLATPSAVERTIIRSHLASVHPETGEGLFARAWLSDAEGDRQAAIGLYRRALEAGPRYVAVISNNLGLLVRNEGRVEEALEILTRGLASDPDDFWLSVVVFETYFNHAGDQSRAREFIAETASALGADHFVVHRLNAYLASLAGDYRAAADAYERASERDGTTFSHLEVATNLRFDHLSDSTMSANERLAFLEPVIEFARRKNHAGAYLYVARKMRDVFNSPGQAFMAFEMSFNAHPTAEAAEEGFLVLAGTDFVRAFELLERAVDTLPTNHAVLTMMSWAYDTYLFDPAVAEAYGRDAIALSPTAATRANNIVNLSRTFREMGNFDAGLALLQAHIPNIAERERSKLLAELATNRLWAGAFDAAAAAAEEARAAGRLSESWYELNRMRIETALSLDGERRRFLDENPFLRDWEQRFGESLRLAVEFDVNSAVIPQSAHGMLDNAAAALLAPGGERYVFMIEGHTDITGNDAINIPLSERRAEAVAAYLHERHNIPLSRLQSAGFGPRHPVATNSTVEGLAANRRVEIRPHGNLADPTVAVPGPLNTGYATFSPDGRFFSSGSYPAQIWDARLGVKLHDLYRGGDRVFSPNGRYLAAISNFTEYMGDVTNTVYIYDVRTGHVVSQLSEASTIRRISWSPFSDQVVYTTGQGYIKVYSLSQRAITNVSRLGTARTFGPVHWLANGNEIAAGHAHRPNVLVFDAATLELKRVLGGVHWVHTLAASADGTLLTAFDNNGTTKVWNTNDWSEAGVYRSHFTPLKAVPHPTEPWLLINEGFVREGGARVAMLDLTTGQLIATSDAAASATISVSPDGMSAYVGDSEENRIDVLTAHTLEKMGDIFSDAVIGTHVFIDETNGQILSQDISGLHVWDMSTGRKVHRALVSTRVPYAQLYEGGGRLVGVSDDDAIIVFDAGTYSETRMAELPIQATGIEVTDRHIIISGRDMGVEEVDQRDGIVLVYDKQTFALTSRITVPLVTDYLRFSEFRGADFRSITAKDDLIAIVSYWNDGFQTGWKTSQFVQIYDIQSGQQLRSINTGVEPFRLSFSEEETDVVEVHYPGGTYLYDARSGQRQRWVGGRNSEEIRLDDGSVIEWMWNYVRHEDKYAFFPDNLRGVAVDEGRNIVVGITNANELLFYDLETLTRHLTITIRPEGQWIAYSPYGEFTASEFGTEGVYWSLGDSYLPFEALRERFESPRIIQQRLSAIFEGAVDVSPVIVEPVIEADLFDVPYTLDLVSEAETETQEENFTISLRVELLQTDLPAPQIEFRHNGRVVPASRGFEEEAFFDEESNEVVGINRQFALADGYNLIEASLVYRGARLLTQRTEITRLVSHNPVETIRPTTQLWYFGVGVSEYEIDSQNLNFAHRDALMLEEQFKAQEGVLYAKVNTRVLINEKATERNVRIELNEFLRQASGEDVIVIFVAGHGVRDSDQNLYFMTHDGDMSRPFSGMSMAHFHDVLSARPINQKAIFLMDICHAGAFGMQARSGRPTIEDAIQQLSTGTGTIVLASSTGAQSSYEDESFGGGHGAFTAAMLEGIAGQADAKAGNGDGVTSIQELMSYVSRRVPEMTDFNQHPTVPLASNIRDFPVAVH